MRHLTLAQLERIAELGGYPTYRDQLYELYVVGRLGIPALAERCNISPARAKKHLLRHGIPLHKRGGRYDSNTKVVLTPTLIREIAREGIPSVARRMGVEQAAIAVKLKTVDLSKIDL